MCVMSNKTLIAVSLPTYPYNYGAIALTPVKINKARRAWPAGFGRMSLMVAIWRSRYIRGYPSIGVASDGAEIFRAGLAALAVNRRFE